MSALLATAAIVVGCSARIEVADTTWPRASTSNVALERAVIFTGLRGYERFLPQLRQPNGWYFAKTPTAVHAGHRITLSIAARDRRWARLVYGDAASAAAVTLDPCPAATPRFSGGGTVGAWTGFSGGFVVARAGCVHFTLAVGRARPTAFGVGIGRRCR